MREVKEGEYYRHIEDKLYQVVTIATHTETGEKMVVYQGQSGENDIWACPLKKFTGEADPGKYPDGEQKYLFEKVEEPTRVNPMLVRFLDARTYRDKLELFQCWETYADDQLLESIAASLDITLSGSSEKDKFRQIVNCLKTMQHFETDRFR